MNCFLTAWDREGRGCQRESPWRPPRGETGEALGKEEKLTIYARLNTGAPRLFLLILAILLSISGFGPAGSRAQTAAEAAARAPVLRGWTRLVLEGRKFFVARGRSVIERRRAERGTQPTEEVRVVSTARVLGRSLSRHQVTSRSLAGGRLLEWVEVDGKGRARRGRLEPGSLVVTRFRRPDEGQGALGWLLDRRRRLAVPAAWDELPAIDPYGLLGRLAVATAAGRGKIQLLTRRGTVEVVYRVGAPRRERWRLQDEDSSRRRHDELSVRRVELVPSRQGGRTLFDMEGPLELWIEEGSGALLKISGRSPKMRGTITLRLTSFSRRALPPFGEVADLPADPPAAEVEVDGERPGS